MQRITAASAASLPPANILQKIIPNHNFIMKNQEIELSQRLDIKIIDEKPTLYKTKLKSSYYIYKIRA